MMEWISLSEKKPEDLQYIKIKSEDHWDGEGFFDQGDFKFYRKSRLRYGEATHWMPISKED